MKIRIIFLTIVTFLMIGLLAFGQNKNITITGTVTDKAGAPVKSATIFIDNQRTNVTTNSKGFYRIKVSDDAKKIQVFTFFTEITEEEINGRLVIDFILSAVLEETSGRASTNNKKTKKGIETNPDSGMNLKEENSNGKIDYQDVQFSSYQNIYELIRGRFPGVEVTGNSIKIYGSSSLNVGTEPLFVVDGVIVNSIDNIDPHTVKSIDILKGPEATSYGIRGSNGVIVITRVTGKDK